jgi:hypothetical protein
VFIQQKIHVFTTVYRPFQFLLTSNHPHLIALHKDHVI